jgi:hypothetical protein
MIHLQVVIQNRPKEERPYKRYQTVSLKAITLFVPLVRPME